jgi:alpha-L-fucosidase
VIPDGFTDIAAMQKWHWDHDGHWYEDSPNQKFVDNWALRCQDLLDKYHPDFLYFDDTELPFGQVGLNIAAHFYNSNLAFNHGNLTAVMTAKHLQPEHKPALVEDYERGIPDAILPLPWQTDTCIGDWHYKKDIQYKSVATVVKMLADVVSKNGNLLLSIPVRGDGTIDGREMQFLAGLTQWMDINSSAIFSSRPWKIYGEGPARTGGMFKENNTHYTAADIRFTTKGGNLYAFVLGIPTEDIQIRSLATTSPFFRPVRQIELLCSQEQVHWAQHSDALIISQPAHSPSAETLTYQISF